MYIPNTERVEKTLQFNIILHGINNGVAQQDFFLSSSTVIHTSFTHIPNFTVLTRQISIQ